MERYKPTIAKNEPSRQQLLEQLRDTADGVLTDLHKIPDESHRYLCAHPDIQSLVPPEFFFALYWRRSEASEQQKGTAIALAKEACKLCPVSNECVIEGCREIYSADGTSQDILGIWGGTTPSERTAIKGAMRRRTQFAS